MDQRGAQRRGRSRSSTMLLPLIQGEPNLPKVDSLPRFAKLKKVLVK
ncbi:MAG: hypothetical protein ACLUS6_14395 [Dysosmobacter sp.]